VKSEHSSAWVTVNCKVCKPAIALYVLFVVPSTVYKMSTNPLQNPSYKSHTNTLHVTILCKVERN
jgi:hypothetical protein